jgi:curved DNA-binding protein CbpA
MDDFYDLFGVEPDADESDLKQAYRRLARQYHPDVNDDPRAHAQFKTVRRAYEVLTDAEERRAYDEMGHSRYVSERMDGYPTMGGAGASTRWGDDAGSSTGAETGTDSGTDATAATDSEADATSPTTRSEARPSGDDDRFDPENFDAEEFDRKYGTSRSVLPPASPLLGGWLAVLVAGLAYLAGVGQYLSANAEALSAFGSAVASSPSNLVAGSFGFEVPMAFLTASFTASGPALLFPIGLIALPVVFGAVVLKFGQGTAYLYLLGAFAPLVVVLGGAAVPTALALPVVLGLVVLPVSGTLLFLGDVGRYLAATR